MASKAIKTPEELWTLFVKYKIYVKSNPVLKQVFVGKDGDSKREEREAPLSMVGFECFICDHVEGINFPDISQYVDGKSDSYKAFSSISSRIKAEIVNDHTRGGMTMIYSQSITARINGWKEEINSTVTKEKKIKVILPE